MMLVLIIILLVLCLGGLPQLGYHNYGWGPSGGLGFILIILVVIVLLSGRW